ncbi:unnamed protein product [Paramecium octaurelia]|nr:unnamed protein product [Paramecium octaurelia]
MKIALGKMNFKNKEQLAITECNRLLNSYDFRNFYYRYKELDLKTINMNQKQDKNEKSNFKELQFGDKRKNYSKLIKRNFEVINKSKREGGIFNCILQ